MLLWMLTVWMAQAVASPAQFVSTAPDAMPMVLTSTDIDATVQAGLAVVALRQVWENPSERPIDAHYTLPLPPDAAVRHMEMHCQGRRIIGEVQSREQARATYTAARAAGQQAALLEQERGNWFRQQVGGICPGESIVIDIEYVTTPAYTDQTYQLILPTAIGERYKPDGLERPRHTRRRTEAPTLAVSVSIEEGLAVSSLWSDTHDIDVVEEQRWGTRVELLDGAPDGDFTLSWSLSGEEPLASALYTPGSVGEPGYISVRVEPTLSEAIADPVPRDLIFVLDASCSMAGRPWEQAQDSVRRALDSMDAGDTFNLLKFSSQVAPLFETSQPATPDNIALAQSWLSSFLGGGTDMEVGLRRAMRLPGPSESLRTVLLLTDGYIGTEEDVYRTVEAHRGDARVFALGIGSSVNHHLLERVARAGRGASLVQYPDPDAEDAISTVQEWIARPVMTDVSLRFTGLAVSSVVPERIPDLWTGRPIRVMARATSRARGSVVISGQINGSPKQITIPIQRARLDNDALAMSWARAQIADHMVLLPESQREAVVLPLALQHHLVSRYTSLVATSSQPAQCSVEATEVSVPHLAPRDSRLSTGQGNHGGGQISFEDADVDGALVKPSGTLLLSRQRATMNPLIQIRDDFDDSMRESAAWVGTASDTQWLQLLELATELRTDLKACIDGPLMADKDGQVDLYISVRAGRVVVIRLLNSSTAELGIASCMMSRVESWEFGTELNAEGTVSFSF